MFYFLMHKPVPLLFVFVFGLVCGVLYVYCHGFWVQFSIDHVATVFFTELLASQW